ncbi:hypothetical protein [Actinophytocola oryzae]|uniref:Uncharacterized protein n=1 Tax=Actinophytocola oryzae TaxID=502181 RepID=A0A4R7W3J8_9PSEU|nr:hypothetical protein [Actinophytocola oryzae]TDV57230.1 hypothetical protein CLV71_101101 [Actinophytocola oryzae]
MTAELSRWSGVAAGVCVAAPAVVEAFTGETAATSLVIALSPALAVPLLVLLHLRQKALSGPFGELAYTVNAIGLGLFGGAAFTLNTTLFYLDDEVVTDLLAGPTKYALLGSALVFAVGAILFGTSMLRTRLHPRVAATAYLVAFPVLALAARLPDTPLTSVVHLVAGTSLVWLALALPAAPGTSTSDAVSVPPGTAPRSSGRAGT